MIRESCLEDDSEEQMIADAIAGPNWNCFYCETNNRGKQSSCSQCGSNGEYKRLLTEVEFKKEKPYIRIGLAVLFGIISWYYL
jgi:hypothetical protein